MSIRQYWPITENDVYVKVFVEILSEIDHSLVDGDHISAFEAFPLESKYLVTRMYLRAPKWIRIEDFTKYMALETLKDVALPPLIEKGWIGTSPPVGTLVSDVASLKELQDLAKTLGLKVTNQTRTKLASQLVQLEKQQAFFNPKVRTKIADGLKIECYLLEQTVRLFLFQLEQLFLLPLGPDATLDIVYLTHMKKHSFLKYEYVTQRDKPLFENRASFEAYAQARELSIQIENALVGSEKHLQERAVESEVMAALSQQYETAEIHGHAKAAYTLGRAMFNVSQILMKLHRFQEEYKWIAKYLKQNHHRSKRGVTLIRKLLLEIRYVGESGTTGESSWLVAAINTFYDAIGEVNEIEKLDLQRKSAKLLASIRNSGLQSALSAIKATLEVQNESQLPSEGTAPKIEIPVHDIIAIPLKSETTAPGPGTRVMYAQGVNVEQLALAEYAQPESGSFQGGHFEGSSLTTIFWLLSYDLLFQDPSQFRCAYHSHPMNIQAAINNNETAIMERIQGNIVSTLKNNMQTLLSLGEPRPLVGSIHWNIPENALIDILTGLGNKIVPILERLMSDYRKYASGFPDLTLWNAAEGRTKFVEVKSENDTVSDNQLLWMNFMLQHSIEVEICKVIPQKRVPKRKRRS